jgi:hypothetical protein
VNPEAHKIVDEMEKQTPVLDAINAYNPGATHNYLSIRMCRLLFLLAEDAEKSSEKLAAQTDKLVEQIKKLHEISDAHKLISENSGKSTDELNRQTTKLIEVAHAQKQLAEEGGKHAKNLSEQTDRLVNETVKLTKFTRGVYWLTFILGLFALIQIIVMLFEYFSQSR